MICFGYKDKATQTLSLPGSIYFGGTREGHGRDTGGTTAVVESTVLSLGS